MYSASKKLSKASSCPPVNLTSYHNTIGGLRYLVNASPDIAHAVGYLSRFMEEPHEDHLAAVKHVLRYIAGTRHHGAHYARGKGGLLKLHGFSDSDMAGDLDTRRSTSSVLFFLGSRPSRGNRRSRRWSRCRCAKQSTLPPQPSLAKVSGKLGS